MATLACSQRVATIFRALFAAGALVSYAHGAAAPVYVATDLTSAETCTRPVKWKAPKVPLAHAEIDGPVPTAPIVWQQHFQTERRLFSYNPVFAPGPVSIAPNGRIMIRDRALNLQILKDDGSWKTISLLAAVQRSLQQQGLNWTTGLKLFGDDVSDERRIVFDEQCHAYTVVNATRSSLKSALLLHSRDGGHSWAAYKLQETKNEQVRMEVPSSTQHKLKRPPVLVLHQNPHEMTQASRALLIFPEKATDGTLSLGTPITMAETMCCADHSGNETQVIGDTHPKEGAVVHFAYPDSNPHWDDLSRRYYTVQKVVTYKRKDHGILFAGPKVIGIGFDGTEPGARTEEGDAKANPHNQPALALDSKGILHAVVSGHDSTLLYTRTLKPHDTSRWSPPERLHATVDCYTYPSLLIDENNRPHIFVRWCDNNYRFKLVHRFRSSKGWEQVELLNPGRWYKSEWYHEVSMDPGGRIFISYSYYPTNLWADEAAAYGSAFGFSMSKLDPSCPSFELTRENDKCIKAGHPTCPRYCEYTGYSDVSPGILIRASSKTGFRLGTTSEFFNNPPTVNLRK